MGGLPFEFFYVLKFIPKLASTLNVTLLIVGGSLLTGLLAGLLAALPRLYRIPVLEQLSKAYASFFRGTPILIQLFLFYYGLPEVLKWIGIDVSKTPVLVFVILTYGLHTGAYVSETIRASILAVDRGQVEAAYSIGMRGHQAFARIVAPQALAIAVPVFSNMILALLKDTSLAFTLGVMEMTGKAQTLASLTQHFFEAYLALAFVYFVLAFVLEKLLLHGEKRLLRHERGSEAAASKFRLRRRVSLRQLAAELKGGTPS
ncbi:amino acid ABC transporter permease [Paenibacillus sp. P22]|uniref:amino acid ABC transporter permease n=1 Tax=Paenibacillus sp. P22 TaxID=483908 RepID=UPI00040B8731|nr:amino acid ABC transporter permease [Paenibacillus sp. P22]CDN41593.1 L-cystine transport system permease protein TcyL [Paenibacillus sp. P22]